MKHAGRGHYFKVMSSCEDWRFERMCIQILWSIKAVSSSTRTKEIIMRQRMLSSLFLQPFLWNEALNNVEWNGVVNSPPAILFFQ